MLAIIKFEVFYSTVPYFRINMMYLRIQNFSLTHKNIEQNAVYRK